MASLVNRLFIGRYLRCVSIVGGLTVAVNRTACKPYNTRSFPLRAGYVSP